MWENLTVQPQELFRGPEPHGPPVPSSCPPQLLPCLQHRAGHRAWEATADSSVSCFPRSRSQPGQLCGDNRMGWGTSENSLPLPGGTARLEKTGHKTRQGPLKDQLVQTQAFHRRPPYPEPDVSLLGPAKNRSLHQLRHHREPGVSPKTWLSQNQTLSTERRATRIGAPKRKW